MKTLFCFCLFYFLTTYVVNAKDKDSIVNAHIRYNEYSLCLGEVFGTRMQTYGSDAIKFTMPNSFCLTTGIARVWQISSSHFEIGGAIQAGIDPLNRRFDVSGTSFYQSGDFRQKIIHYNDLSGFISFGPKLNYVLGARKHSFLVSINPFIRGGGAGANKMEYMEATKDRSAEFIYIETNNSVKGWVYGCTIAVAYRIAVKGKIFFSISPYLTWTSPDNNLSFEIMPGTAYYAYGTATVRKYSTGLVLSIGRNH